MKRVALAAALAALGLTAPAQAATLVNSGGKLTFTATSGAPVNVSFSYGNTDYVGVIPQSAYHRDPIQVTGCTTNLDASFVYYTCPNVTSVTAIGGPSDDVFGSQSLAVPLTAMGGAGDDQLEGGEAADTFDGGPGDDFVFAETGDTIGGGSGTDRVRYTVPGSDRFTSEGVNLAPVGLPVSFTLDGIADDGLAGDGVNVLPDVEDVESDGRTSSSNQPLPTYGPVTIVGTDAANRLIGSNGPDTLTGGGGIDVLEGGAGDDTLFAVDGVADRVRCGTGTDTAHADPQDVVSDTCETVLVTATLVRDDAAPRIAWGSGLTVDATDDRGITRVQWFDDERLICTDEAAPFDCAYTPRVEDVGPNTIVAIATDTAGQTASVVTTRAVPRLEPITVTLRLRRRVASGKVTLPTGVPCAGKVTVGGRTVSLRKNCTYRVTVKRAKSYVARFLGTNQLAPMRSKRVRART